VIAGSIAVRPHDLKHIRPDGFFVPFARPYPHIQPARSAPLVAAKACRRLAAKIGPNV